MNLVEWASSGDGPRRGIARKRRQMPRAAKPQKETAFATALETTSATVFETTFETHRAGRG